MNFNIKWGQRWQHKKSGRKATVIETPFGEQSRIHLLQESGRRSVKNRKSFLADYELIK